MSDTTTLNAKRAATLNKLLAEGKTVVVSTYTKAFEYGKRHVGWFEERGGNLCVKSGRSYNRLTTGNQFIVSIKVYETVEE